MTTRDDVLDILERALTERKFHRRPADGPAGCWVRRTAMTNRALIALDVPDDVDDPAPWVRTQRRLCARSVGFKIPFLYHPGIQVVTLGPAAKTHPVDAVDRIDNQWCVIQAIHVVDLQSGRFVSASTWGQVISGPDQQAVARALATLLTPQPPDG
ncbi:MAG: hypothetical protein KTR31_20125 [Myxococcales bacterium]|nr:hypothetical protein [Myxococcales bacterium]